MDVDEGISKESRIHVPMFILPDGQPKESLKEFQEMKALEKLKEMIKEDQRAKYPTIPDHALTVNTFEKMSPEKREKKRIEKFLNLSKGCKGTIIENRGQRIDNRKVVKDSIGRQKVIGSVEFIGSGMRRGIADILAVINGRSVEIELKRHYKKGKDRQSVFQKEEQRKAEESGGVYIIVKDFEEFYQWYVDYIN